MNDEMLLLAGSAERSVFGSDNYDYVMEMMKALNAPSGLEETYGAEQTSGGVLALQSLEGMLVNLTANEKDFVFYNDISKMKAFQTVEEFDVQIGHGISDGGFVGIADNPEFRDPDFLKDLAIVKYMSEGWSTNDVSVLTRRLVDEQSAQQRSAMIRLLRNLNIALYTGDSALIPKSIDGVSKVISTASTDQIRDMRGGSLSLPVFDIAGQIITEANGNVENSKIYLSPAAMPTVKAIIEAGAVSTGDRRIVDMGKSGITIGGHVSDVMTSFGNMTLRMDKFLGLAYENKDVPKYFNQQANVWVEGATSANAPSMPSIALTNVSTVTSSQFSTGTVRPSGVKYNYRVVARNAYGRSLACAAVLSTDVIAAGGGVTITITPNPADSGVKIPSCFEIYSEKVGGSGVYRYMHTIAASANPLSIATYTDKNDYIPGTARIFIIDQTQTGEDRVMSLAQLLPVHNTPLAKMSRTTQGLINLYCVPKYYKKNVLVEIRNIGVEPTNIKSFNMI